MHPIKNQMLLLGVYKYFNNILFDRIFILDLV